MPRPSKHVSPDTLGGRIRAAREALHLSLAEVADGHYSTSLISQIERNRVDPSQDSLHFLAERLKLPLEELEVLAQQHRESEVEPHQFKSGEDLRTEVALLLKNKEISKAIDLLKDLQLSQVPPLQRWRLVALRGQCYFEQKQFLTALQDFVYAIKEQPKPDNLSAEQKQELMLLHLRLACVYRILDLDDARKEYETALDMMNRSTPSGYAAEAYWGLAIIAYMQAYKIPKDAESACEKREEHLLTALGHADNARHLYHSVGEKLRVATVICQIAQIKKELGRLDEAHTSMQEVLKAWEVVLQEPEATRPEAKQNQKERANIVSAAASTLAHLAFKTQNYQPALEYVSIAIQAGEQSNTLRRADAYILHGCILEAINGDDPSAGDAFRQAIALLATTERMPARINAHNFLGQHLLKQGRRKEGEQEIELARSLALYVEESIIIAQTDTPH